MKKVAILLVALALTFFSAPAFALNNLVTNPDFTSNLDGWSNEHGYYAFEAVGGVAQAVVSEFGYDKSYMWQIVEAPTSGGAAEVVNFSFEYYSDVGVHSSYAAAALYYWVGSGIPDDFNLDDPGSDWQLIYNSGRLSYTYEPTTVAASFPISDEPQYFAIGFIGASALRDKKPIEIYYAYFDNITLTVAAVPLPPSLLLVASGLLGLVGLRFSQD